ncbi:5'-deoxynucleotidase [Clostridia bacterium]|nr:5'-deoxynucleotidase [Clostridia bacterium]
MNHYSFFAMITRMKYINRWGLMNNTRQENLSEHSLEVAVIAHSLAVIHNVRFGGNVNTERAALLGIYHDSSEIITGDLPTPIKYYNPDIQTAYKSIEAAAQERLVKLLPEDLAPIYANILTPANEDTELLKFIKAADKLSALIKCIEELRMGNKEFSKAENSTRKALEAMSLPEVNVFMQELLPAFELTLDDL